MASTLPQMLTASRLKDGDVLYWKGTGWVLNLKDGDVFPDQAAAEAALASAQGFVTANQVVAPYLFDVRVENGRIRPVKEREIIRAAGPTVRPDTGKQAAPAPSSAMAVEMPAAALAGAQPRAAAPGKPSRGEGGRNA